jgi:5-methylcytosine-specific restriction endonuclease McrA
VAGNRGPNGARYRAARLAVLQPDEDGLVLCHLCGHDGADQADHLLPRSLHPDLDDTDTTNLLPAHGNKGCPICGEKCNQVKGNGTVTRPVRSRAW